MKIRSGYGLGAVAAALLVAAGVIVVVVGGGSSTESPPGAVASPVPSPAATAAVTPTPPNTPPAIDEESPLSGPIEDGFVRRAVAPDELPEEEFGILFLDLATGQGELWTDAGARATQGERYAVDESHRWLQAWSMVRPDGPGPPIRAIIADRLTAESYVIDEERWSIVAGPTPSGRLVLQSRERFTEYVVVELAEEPTLVTLRFSLPQAAPPEALTGTMLLGDGDLLLVARRSEMIDLRSGEVRRIAEPAAFSPPEYTFASVDGGWLAVGTFGLPSRWQDDILVFDASGDRLPKGATPAGFRQRAGSMQPSPDGRWLAVAGSLEYGSIAFTSTWHLVLMVDLEGGEVAFRALQAGLKSQVPQWLSDSSALVVATPEGYALLFPDGSLQPLPFGPVEQPGRAGMPVPVPAPHDASLFLYRGRVMDRDGRQVSSEAAASDWAANPPWNTYGFSAAGDEIRLVQSPAPGRDVGLQVIAALGLPVRIEHAPFEDAVRLQVSHQGRGAELRRHPGGGEEVLAHLSDGSLLTLTESGERSSATWINVEDAEPDTSFLGYTPAWWIHVTTDDGVEGWIRSWYVGWAE